MEGPGLGQGDRRNAVGSAIAGMGIRMLAVQALHQLQARQFAGILLLVLEAVEHLVLDPGEGVGGEGRFADHFGEQLQRRLTLVRCAEAAQGRHGHVTVGAVAEVRAEAFEALGNRADVLAGHAFVEHGIGQQGEAGGVAVLAAAGGKGQAQVEHRQLAGFDEQHLGALGGFPGLHVKLSPTGRLVVQFGQGLQFAAGRGFVQCLAGLGGA